MKAGKTPRFGKIVRPYRVQIQTGLLETGDSILSMSARNAVATPRYQRRQVDSALQRR